jgi:hypothetical protein
MQHLANASQTKRPTSCLMVLPKPLKPTDGEADADMKDLYEKVEGKMKKLEYMP